MHGKWVALVMRNCSEARGIHHLRLTTNAQWNFSLKLKWYNSPLAYGSMVFRFTILQFLMVFQLSGKLLLVTLSFKLITEILGHLISMNWFNHKFCAIWKSWSLKLHTVFEPHGAYKLNKLLKDVMHFSAQLTVKDSSPKLKLAWIFASYV